MKTFLLPALAVVLVVSVSMSSVSGTSKKELINEILNKTCWLKTDVRMMKDDMTILPEIKKCVTKLGDRLDEINEMCRKTLEEGLSNPPKPEPKKCDSFSKNLIKLRNGYHMVFRVTPGIERSAYDRFLQMGQNDDQDDFIFWNVQCGCKTTDGRLPCDRHYRSKLLDIWERLSLERVRVSVYVNNVERKYFEFNADNIQRSPVEFFRQALIEETVYTDISSTTNPAQIFSIEGETATDKARRFYIANNSGTCSSDSGWLVVIDDNKAACPWESLPSNAKYPVIRYSLAPTMATWSDEDDVGFADALVISVKMKDVPDC